uniref:Uncharacterized protein n=1 Tax=Oryza brachyantha TaxID=4533 RepID=J3N243_ORYBR
MHDEINRKQMVYRQKDWEELPIPTGDTEPITEAEAWFDQTAEYWKQAIALTLGNYIEAHSWLIASFVFICSWVEIIVWLFFKNNQMD